MVKQKYKHTTEVKSKETVQLQTKITMKYHFTSLRMATIEKKHNNKCW